MTTDKEKKFKDRISAISSIYLVMFEIDLLNDTYVEIKSKKYVNTIIEKMTFSNCQESLRLVMSQLSSEKSMNVIMEFIDFSTINERLKDRNTITQEFQSTVGSQIWARARFIVVDRTEDGRLHKVIWAVESIDADKKEKERLQKAAEISEASSRAKSAFLANMSHEIRTPINAILGMNEMILREAEDLQLLEYAKNIQSAGNALLSIVNDILDFSRVEAGKMEIIPQDYDLSSVIIDLINMTKDKAENKDLTYNIEIDQNIPRELYGDNIRIKQCILNLLSNAVKYTQKGCITFSMNYTKVDDENIDLTVKISDTGIGIKDEDLKKIFSPFDRAEEERNKTIEGTGLGLSIVQDLLRLMGSSLNIKSEYNVGSEFSFTIRQKIINLEPIGNFQEAYESSLKIIKYQEKLYAPEAQLLFVDDTQINLDVLCGLLKQTGMKIDTATSGMAALRKVCENHYNIIFIDHRMPEMDGIETLEAMRTLPENLNKETPCIALTANAIHGSREMYIKTGFADYISKPVNPDKLEKIIKKYLPEELIHTPPKTQQNEPSNIKFNKTFEGIDINSALTNCGDVSLMEKMFAQFQESIEAKACELENYLAQNDITNYRIKVHALKSTSRLIGALKLSEKAEKLEHAADSGNVDFIKENTPELLKQYRSFITILQEYSSSAQEEESDKKEISSQKLNKIINQIITAAENYDYDALENLQKELAKYKLPLDFSSIYDKIDSCIFNVNFEGLQALLPDLKKIQEGVK